MNLVNSIIDYLKRKEEGKDLQAPEGVCPNCWGEQQYDNLIRDKVKDSQVGVNTHKSKHAFIQDFVVNHVNGIKLKNTLKGVECAKCKAFKPH
ncbi:MAG: hypothetical protein ACI85I_002133 [Arenicella sp.]|jgi:hypothetical protein